MDKPKVGRTYIFVRRRGDGFEHTEYTRHEDGSAGFLADGYYTIFECRPDAWRRALDRLAEIGFVELLEARRRGVIPAEWEPSPETSTLASCSGPVSPVPVDPPID